MAGTTSSATSNGHRSFPENLLKAAGRQITRRVPRGDLDQRDPDYIRERLTPYFEGAEGDRVKG